MVSKKTKSSKFLRSCIFEALMLLMEQKDYDDIGISEITSKAGVSRMTYYRTYSSKEDIFIQYFTEYIDEHFPPLEESTDLSYSSWMRAVLEAAAGHTDLIHLLEKNPKLAKICLKFFLDSIQSRLAAMLGADLEDQETIYRIYYHGGAAAIVIHHWVENGCRESVDDILNILDSAQSVFPLLLPEKKAVETEAQPAEPVRSEQDR